MLEKNCYFHESLLNENYDFCYNKNYDVCARLNLKDVRKKLLLI